MFDCWIIGLVLLGGFTLKRTLELSLCPMESLFLLLQAGFCLVFALVQLTNTRAGSRKSHVKAWSCHGC